MKLLIVSLLSLSFLSSPGFTKDVFASFSMPCLGGARPKGIGIKEYRNYSLRIEGDGKQKKGDEWVWKKDSFDTFCNPFDALQILEPRKAYPLTRKSCKAYGRKSQYLFKYHVNG